MKAPNSKLQAPEKHQASNFNGMSEAHRLDVETCSFSGTWMLVLGGFAS
jgi:hypothetical protein